MYHYAGNNSVRYTDPDGKETKKTLRIDIGHGENDPGATVAGGKEIDFNWKVGTALVKYLSANLPDNINLKGSFAWKYNPDALERNSDRVILDKKDPVDLLISIHFNYVSDSKREGILLLYGDENSKTYADKIFKELNKSYKLLSTGRDTRGVFHWTPVKRFGGRLTSTTVVVECGYLSNKADFEYFSKDEKVEIFAKCLGDSILKSLEE